MPPSVLKQVARVLAACFVLVGSTKIQAEETAPVIPSFTSVSWLPIMTPALISAKFHTDGVTLAPPGTCIQKEDAVTLLVESIDGQTVRQWAVTLIINPRKPEEKKYFSPAQTLYLNTGGKVDFGSNVREGLAIHVIGPYSKAKGAAKAKDVWSGALVNLQFLNLGLDSIPELILRMKEKSTENPAFFKGKNFSIQAGPAPYPAALIAGNRSMAETLAITEKESRSFAGASPALMDFFGIAIMTPGVRDILEEAVDIPWLKIATHGGHVEVNFELVEPFEKLSAADWNLPPDMNTYSMGMRILIFDRPALNCRLALTTPRVPLLNCAGIVGLAAMRPDGKGPHLMMRVIAAKPAPAPAAP